MRQSQSESKPQEVLAASTSVLLEALNCHVRSPVTLLESSGGEGETLRLERARQRDRYAGLGILLSPIFLSSPLGHQICECQLGFSNRIKAPGDFSPIQHHVNQKNHPAGPTQPTVP